MQSTISANDKRGKLGMFVAGMAVVCMIAYTSYAACNVTGTTNVNKINGCDEASPSCTKYEYFERDSIDCALTEFDINCNTDEQNGTDECNDLGEKDACRKVYTAQCDGGDCGVFGSADDEEFVQENEKEAVDCPPSS